MTISRKRFLQSAGLATAGAAIGYLGRGALSGDPIAEGIARLPVLPPVQPAPPASPPAPSDEAHGEESFSQSGEDLIINFTFRYLGIGGPITYLDVGANHPTDINNTYYFYKRGHRGVLVEPNAALEEQLRTVRPGDKTLVAGIGVTAAKEADYYMMTHHSLNTFSKEEAEHETAVTKGRITVQKVIKVPLLNINDVMDEHFKGAPTFISIDTEGMDLAILKTVDFTRFRPKLICAETLVFGTHEMTPKITEYMETQGYVDRGGSIVNTIYIDSKIL